MASDVKEAIRRMIYRYVVEGADEVMATQEAVAASTTKTDKASLSLEKAFGGLERRYVETVRHQQDYQKVQEKVNAAVAQNPALQERANAVLAAAGKHFDNLASRGNFFTEIVLKGFNRFLGPMALFNLALTGIGAVIGYVAAQWQSSSTTVEQAIAEQNRLLAESKKLLDANTSAQERMYAQSGPTLQIQALQNLIDLQVKYNEQMERSISLAEKRSTTPTQVAGEMGEAPTGMAPRGGPGYAEITDAVTRFREAQEAGTASVAQFNTELARIALANPSVRQLALDIIQAADGTEQAKIKGEALLAVLAGIATDAQRVAAGFQTIAQTDFNNMNAQAAAAALERMAIAGLQLAQTYPGMSHSVAQQLALLQGALDVANARGQQETIIATEIARQNALLMEGKSLEEATAIAAAERAVAEANIAKTSASTAGTVHDTANNFSQVNTQVGHFNSGLRLANNQTRSILGNIITWTNSFAEWGDIAKGISNKMDMVTTQSAGKIYTFSYDPLGVAQQKAQMEKLYGAQNIEPVAGWGLEGNISGYKLTEEYLKKQREQNLVTRDTGAYVGSFDVSSPAAIQQSFSNIIALGFKDGLGSLNRLIDVVADPATQANLIAQAINYIQATQPPSLAREEMILDLNDKLEALASSTDSLNATMQQALSPFYSQDPRTTRLGFRAGVVGNPDWLAPGASNQNPLAAILGPGATAPGMANGGSFVVGGGYSANDNRIAAFPVASGEEVVVNRNRGQGSSAQVINIDNRIIVTGSIDADTMSKLKVSKYQQAQRMRAGLSQAS